MTESRRVRREKGYSSYLNRIGMNHAPSLAGDIVPLERTLSRLTKHYECAAESDLATALVGEKRGLDFERALICILIDERFLRVLNTPYPEGIVHHLDEEIIRPLKAEFEG